MAITERGDVCLSTCDAMSNQAPGQAQRFPVARTWQRACAALFFTSLIAPAVQAQKVAVDMGVSTSFTASDNVTLGGIDSQGDAYLVVRPRIAVRAEGARLRVSGTAGLNLSKFAKGTQSSSALPEADMTARLEAIERFLYLEGGLRVTQISENPFGVAAGTVANGNTLTAAQARLSPVIESSLDSDTRYRLASENSKTIERGATSAASSRASGYFGRHRAFIEHDPHPLGWKLEAERSQTRFDDASQRDLSLDLVRATADYELVDSLSVGVRLGYERNSFATLGSTDTNGPIYGVQARWRPSERTLLSGYRETRVFGDAWRVEFVHRAPMVVWNIQLSRGIESSLQSLYTLPPTDNVAGLLDAAFTTRYPDATERARVVQDFITRQGLPASLAGQATIYSQRLSLVTSQSASFALIGVRNALSLRLFNVRVEDVLQLGLLDAGLAINNNVDTGFALTASHRLTPLTNVSATGDYSRIRALSGVATGQTKRAGIALQLNTQVSSKATASFGLRHRKIGSSVLVPGSENAAFAAFDQRF